MHQARAVAAPASSCSTRSLASIPTASMHTSAPRPPVISRSTITGSSTWSKSSVSTPLYSFANRSRSGTRSTAMTRPAPISHAESWAKSPTGPRAEDHHRLALLDLPHLGRLVAGGQDVAEEEHLLVLHVVGDLGGPDVGERHPHVLGLAALEAPGGVRVAEHARGDVVGGGVGVLAVGEQATLAEEAAAAGDVERNHHPVAPLQGPDVSARLLDDPGELVAEGAPHPGVGDEAVKKVEVRAADGGAGDPEDDVLGVLDAGVRLLDHRDLPRAEVGECAHGRKRLGSPSCPGHPRPGPPSGGRP